MNATSASTDSVSTTPTAPGDRAQRRAAARRRTLALGSAALLASGTGAIVAVTSGIASASGPLDVTTCADSGGGSLRDAIAYANGHGGPDTITITASCPIASPVALISTLEVTGDGLTITGPGASAFVLDGDDSVRVLKVTGSGDFAISGVGIQAGYTLDGDGAGLWSRTSGAVTITGVSFSDSTAQGDARGGGANVRGAGSVTIADSTFASNQGTQGGGGLYVNQVGDVTLTGDVFLDNAASSGAGGGAHFYSVDSLTITDSTFSGNEATGSAGGLYAGNSGPITVSSSTFDGNSASNGGGIRIYSNRGDIRIVNSTITGNAAAVNGGVALLYFYGDAEIAFTTIADNTNGGLATTGLPEQTLTVTGSIFSGNAVPASLYFEVRVDNADVTVVEDHNLFDGAVLGFTPDATDVLYADPLLGALADNGGPTRTRALGAGSPAIGAGPTSFAPFPGSEYDQRGVGFDRVSGGEDNVTVVLADIGAFEVQAVRPTPQPTPEPEPQPEPTFTG